MGACTKAKYGQCGGEGFTGDICCPSGEWCMQVNQWWAQCEPCVETWDVSCAAMPVALDQLPRAVKLQRPTVARSPTFSSAVQHREQGHAFLSRKAQRLRGMVLLHVASKLQRQRQ